METRRILRIHESGKSQRFIAEYLDIIEDRHKHMSSIFTSQIPVEKWYEIIGDKTVANAILDRLVYSSHRIELKGESYRKRKSRKSE